MNENDVASKNAKDELSVETWVVTDKKDDYDYVEVSNFGRVRRTLPLTQHIYDGRDTPIVCVYKKHRSVAGMVAKAFVPNPNGYKRVFYKDGDPMNTRADNLFWTKRIKRNIQNCLVDYFVYTDKGELLTQGSSQTMEKVQSLFNLRKSVLNSAIKDGIKIVMTDGRVLAVYRH